jgi:hypothetical protein
MIMDYNAQFSDGTTVITFASGMPGGTDSSILDMMTAAWNGGAGTPVWVVVSVGTSISGAASNPLYVEFKSATTSGGTYTTHFTGKTFTIGEVTKGTYLLAQPIPTGMTINRFVKLTYNLVGVSLTAGVVDAYLSLNAPRF